MTQSEFYVVDLNTLEVKVKEPYVTYTMAAQQCAKLNATYVKYTVVQHTSHGKHDYVFKYGQWTKIEPLKL